MTMIVEMLENKEFVEKTQQPSQSTPNNEDNISTKSSTQQSQSSISNTLEIITNNINQTQFYNIDNNSNMSEPFEHRKPTINGRRNHIHVSLDQVKNQMENHHMGETTSDDVDMLKSRIDNIELMLERQNKLVILKQALNTVYIRFIANCE